MKKQQTLSFLEQWKKFQEAYPTPEQVQRKLREKETLNPFNKVAIQAYGSKQVRRNKTTRYNTGNSKKHYYSKKMHKYTYYNPKSGKWSKKVGKSKKVKRSKKGKKSKKRKH